MLHIESLSLCNFQDFRKLDIPKFAGINILIGENDTGKTGLLKLLYATIHAWESYCKRLDFNEISYKQSLADKLFNTFQPRKNGIGDLVTKGAKDKLNLQVEFLINGKQTQQIAYGFGDTTTKKINDCTPDNELQALPDDFHPVYVPAKEILTAFRTIEYTRKQFLPGFDDTYLDLIKDLNVSVRLEKVSPKMEAVLNKIENLFNGTIEQTEQPERFIYKKGNRHFDMSMTAEGIKRMGMLSTLILNWQLREGSILFFDEPGSNLHPKAVCELTNIIVEMAQAGVQIFLSTHSYFIIKSLELLARKHKFPIQCVSLSDSGDGIVAKISDLQNGMPDNRIIDVALQLFDDELEL